MERILNMVITDVITAQSSLFHHTWTSQILRYSEYFMCLYFNKRFPLLYALNVILHVQAGTPLDFRLVSYEQFNRN